MLMSGFLSGRRKCSRSGHGEGRPALLLHRRKHALNCTSLQRVNIMEKCISKKLLLKIRIKTDKCLAHGTQHVHLLSTPSRPTISPRAIKKFTCSPTLLGTDSEHRAPPP